MTTAGKAPAARFEISIDGVPRSYRDRKEMAIEAAGQLMAKYPHSAVAVKREAEEDWGRRHWR